MVDPGGGTPRARFRPPDPREVRVVAGAVAPDRAPVARRPATDGAVAVAARRAEVLRAEALRVADPEPARLFALPVACAVALLLVVGMVTTIGQPPPVLLVPEDAVTDPLIVAAGAPPVTAPLGSGPLDAPGPQVAASTCTLPAMGVSNESVEAWVQASVTCLDAVWAPLVTTAGLAHSRPTVQRFRDQITTTCIGELWSHGFYCGPDRLIGISPSRELAAVPEPDRPGWLLGIMAHEYGHHVQELSGVLPTVDAAHAALDPAHPDRLEASRRVELQATCLAGVSFAALSGRGAVGARDEDIARARLGSGDEAVPGRPRDHGTGEHGLLWFDRGRQSGSPAACNTWTAPTAEVE